MSDTLRRTLRTGLQVALGLAAGLPLLVHTAGLPDTLPGLGVALAVAAAITRLMASPIVDRILPAWLRTAPAEASLPSVTVPLVVTPVVQPAPTIPASPAAPPTNPPGGTVA